MLSPVRASGKWMPLWAVVRAAGALLWVCEGVWGKWTFVFVLPFVVGEVLLVLPCSSSTLEN